MRTEKTMFELIINYAKNHSDIRAVILNGSRANPNATKDKHQDYDIVYIVKNIANFKLDYSWLDIFGNRLIMQTPQTMRDPDSSSRFNWMMLFEDGVRIDLTLIPIEEPDLIGKDSDTVVLLDKDNILPPFPPNSDVDYHVKPPSELFYYSCCNNFWWCIQNVAKGIARDELPYAMMMYHTVVMPDLHDMINWYIASTNNHGVAVGKFGKYYKRFLPQSLYELYKSSYSNADLKASIIAAGTLFKITAIDVANAYDFVYNIDEDNNMHKYLSLIL